MSNFDIQLHSGQLQIFQDAHKVRVFLAGRRTGKSRLMTYELLLAALNFPGRTNMASPERVLGALPTLTQARKVLWTPLKNICEQTAISKYVKAISNTEYRIQFEGHKPDIVIAGSDNDGAGLRGLRLVFAGLDEFQSYKPGIWDSVIYPSMSDTPGSRALITGTPLGKNSYFHEVYQRAEKFPDIYASFQMPTWTNPTIDPLEIEMARKTLPPKIFRQEYDASWESNEFAVYTELDENENRCDRLPDSFDQVLLAVDHGDVHPAIVLWGRSENTWYYIDGYAPNDGLVVAQPFIDAKLVELASRWQPMGSYADPSRPAAILNMRALGNKHSLLGLKRSLAAYNNIADGVNQFHSLIFQRRIKIPREDLTRGRKHHVSGDEFYNQLSNYHYKIDKDGVVTDKIADGQIDHLGDATRYLFARKKANSDNLGV